MPGVEQASQNSWLSDDNNRILLATLTAITLAAGSTVFWRAKHIYHTAPLSGSPENQREGEMDNKSTHGANLDVGGASKTSTKSSRSKERRKRGKDPVKELTKAGGTNTKKGKKRATSNARSETSNPGTGIVVPEIIIEPRNEPEPIPLPPVDVSATASSSGSRSSSRSYPKDRSLLDVVEPEEESDEALVADVISPIPASVSAPSHDSPCARVQESEIIPVTQSEPSIHHVAESSILQPTSFPFAESSSSSSSLTSRTSSPAPSTVPETPRDPNIILHPSLSMYSHYPSPPRMTPSPNGSWDYGRIINNQGPDPATTYIKPPRFRSKSRGSGTVSPVQLPSSMSYILPPFSASMSPPQNPSYLSSTNNESHVLASKPKQPSEIMTDFTFPTLNPVPVTPDSAFESPSRQKLGNHSYSNSSSTLHPQRASTPSYNSSPRRTPTPSQNSNQSPHSSVSVSAQTQLASLRGALEAARMREENTKIEVERLGRECQELRMRWGEDVGLWRIREGELQTHIQMLNQHLQGYASILASMPQTAHLQMHTMSPLQTNGMPNPSFSNIYSPTQGSRQSPSPASGSAQPQPKSPHSHPASPHGNLTSPLAPLAMYPGGMPQPTYQGMFMNMNITSPQMRQGKNQNQQPQAPQPQSSQQSPNPNLFSLFFPGTNGSTPGPGSGTSSGAASPVVGNGSPIGDRGRRRTRIKTSTQREQEAENIEEGALVDEDANDEDEFSGLLADAILKRPESIRGGMFRAAKQEKEKGKSGDDGGAIGEEKRGEVNLNDDGWIRETNPPVNGAQVTTVGSAGLEGS